MGRPEPGPRPLKPVGPAAAWGAGPELPPRRVPPPSTAPGRGGTGSAGPGIPRPTSPGPGAAEELRGEREGGSVLGEAAGLGLVLYRNKARFSTARFSVSFFFEGDVRQGLILHRWAPSDRGAPKGGGESRCHRPATSGHRAPPSAERNGTGRAGTRRAEPGVEGRRRHGGSGRSGAGGPVTGCWYGGAVPGRCGGPGSCRVAELPDRRCWGRCPPPPSGHPPRSVQCPRIGAAAIRVPPHTAGPHLSHGCQHRGGP